MRKYTGKKNIYTIHGLQNYKGHMCARSIITNSIIICIEMIMGFVERIWYRTSYSHNELLACDLQSMGAHKFQPWP